MYGISTYIYHRSQPTLGKYTIHESSGYARKKTPKKRFVRSVPKSCWKCRCCRVPSSNPPTSTNPPTLRCHLWYPQAIAVRARKGCNLARPRGSVPPCLTRVKENPTTFCAESFNVDSRVFGNSSGLF